MFIKRQDVHVVVVIARERGIIAGLIRKRRIQLLIVK
jgi:hypothetical protein